VPRGNVAVTNFRPSLPNLYICTRPHLRTYRASNRSPGRQRVRPLGNETMDMSRCSLSISSGDRSQKTSVVANSLSFKWAGMGWRAFICECMLVRSNLHGCATGCNRSLSCGNWPPVTVQALAVARGRTNDARVCWKVTVITDSWSQRRPGFRVKVLAGADTREGGTAQVAGRWRWYEA